MDDSVDEEIRELRTLFWSERDPEGRAFAPLADAYRRQGDLDQALELLQDGLGRHASFTPGHIVAAWVRRDRGDIDAAGDAFGVALALDEQNSEALRGLGEIAVERGDGATATLHYQKLTELEPDDLEIVARLREIEMSPPVPRVAPESADTTQDFALEDDLPFLAPAEVDEPASAAPMEPETDEDGPITRTMADLYARQGLNERALRVYSRLLERAPGDAGLEERVSAMAALVEAAAAETRGMSWPAEPDQPPAPPEEQPARKAVEKPAARRPSDAEVEALARDWAAGPRATGELSTPFAWTAKPAQPTAPSDGGRPVKDYFRALLEWEPAEMVSAAPVAPPAPAPMVLPIEAPIEVVEPERTVPVVESVAPMPVVEFEAPMPEFEAQAPTTVIEAEPQTRRAVVEIETLAPERVVVAIESLAPLPLQAAGIVSIESLAPVVVDVASLAP